MPNACKQLLEYLIPENGYFQESAVMPYSLIWFDLDLYESFIVLICVRYNDVKSFSSRPVPSGIVRVSAPLDYEVASNYILLLEVIDTQTSLAARAHLFINVTVSSFYLIFFNRMLYLLLMPLVHNRIWYLNDGWILTFWNLLNLFCLHEWSLFFSSHKIKLVNSNSN